MSAILPPAKPRLSQDELSVQMRKNGLHLDDLLQSYPLLVVGLRGYYREMGAKGRNDRMLYDDAICIVTTNVYATFNGNTDPNGYKLGKGTGPSKGMAVLDAGFWPVYRFDLHRGAYLALCQRAGDVTVTRDGSPPYKDTGEFGINIHRGGTNGTSSLGCQTIPPSQWDAFIALATSEAKRLWGDWWKKRTVGYALMET